MRDLSRALVATGGFLTVALLLRTEAPAHVRAVLIVWVVFLVSAVVGSMCAKERP